MAQPRLFLTPNATARAALSNGGANGRPFPARSKLVVDFRGFGLHAAWVVDWARGPGKAEASVVKEWMSVFADTAVTAIDAAAMLIIVVGTIEMFFTCVRSVFRPSPTGKDLRDGYLRYARWLMAGLTFLLANDIIVSARAPSWDDIGRLAAIAFIRTFLNFFLERDIAEAGRFQIDADEPPARQNDVARPQD
jgi:uncharacterized membrane protein